VRGGQKFHMLLERDRFSASSPIVIKDDLSEVRFVLESSDADPHIVKLSLSGLVPGDYSVTGSSGKIANLSIEDGRSAVADLPMGPGTGGASFSIRLRQKGAKDR